MECVRCNYGLTREGWLLLTLPKTPNSPLQKQSLGVIIFISVRENQRSDIESWPF